MECVATCCMCVSLAVVFVGHRGGGQGGLLAEGVHPVGKGEEKVGWVVRRVLRARRDGWMGCGEVAGLLHVMMFGMGRCVCVCERLARRWVWGVFRRRAAADGGSGRRDGKWCWVVVGWSSVLLPVAEFGIAAGRGARGCGQALGAASLGGRNGLCVVHHRHEGSGTECEEGGGEHCGARVAHTYGVPKKVLTQLLVQLATLSLISVVSHKTRHKPVPTQTAK